MLCIRLCVFVSPPLSTHTIRLGDLVEGRCLFFVAVRRLFTFYSRPILDDFLPRRDGHGVHEAWVRRGMRKGLRLDFSFRLHQGFKGRRYNMVHLVMDHLHARPNLVLAGSLDEPEGMNLARQSPIQFRYL